jgi:competence ComEA-like helix-hairpin-helix protein
MQTLKNVARVGVFWTVGLSAGLTADAQSLPDSAGRTEFESACGHCHSLERSTDLRLNAAQWQAVVDDMVGRGALGSSDEFQRIVAYLARHFGPDAPPPLRKISVNRATAPEMSKVLGLAAADTEAIVRHRDAHGPFKGWPDLEKVPGIDRKALEAVKDRIEFTLAAPQSGERTN